MKLLQLILAVVLAALLPLIIVPTINHYLLKPKVSELSQQSIEKKVGNLKVPNKWLSKLPSSLRKDLPGAQQKLAQKAGQLQQKYVAPQIQKYQQGRLATIAGIGVLILLVLVLSRYEILAKGLGVGAAITMLIGFVSTWSTLGLLFKLFLIPALVLLFYWGYLTFWRAKKKH